LYVKEDNAVNDDKHVFHGSRERIEGPRGAFQTTGNNGGKECEAADDGDIFEPAVLDIAIYKQCQKRVFDDGPGCIKVEAADTEFFYQQWSEEFHCE